MNLGTNLYSAFVFDITNIFSRPTVFKNNLIELTAKHMIQSFWLSSDKINCTLCKICQKSHWEVTTKIAKILLNQFERHNFSLVARYSLKFTRCLLLDVNSFVTRCKIRSLLVAEVALCKNSLATRCRSCSLQKFTGYSLQNSLVTLCRSCSLQIFTRYSLQNSLVTCCINLRKRVS